MRKNEDIIAEIYPKLIKDTILIYACGFNNCAQGLSNLQIIQYISFSPEVGNLKR